MDTNTKNECLGRLVLASKGLAIAELLLPNEGLIFAYGALDNTLSAIILANNRTPPNDHVGKIGTFRNLYAAASNMLPRTKRLEKHLDKWMAVRYEGAECSVQEFAEVAHVAHDLFDFARIEVGRLAGEAQDAVVDEVRKRAAQERVEAWREEIDRLQGIRFESINMKVEGLANVTTGAVDPTNFISVHVDTDSPSVRELLREHTYISRLVGELYKNFVRLIETVRIWNADRVFDKKHPGLSKEEKMRVAKDGPYIEALSEGADFRLVAILSYQGTELLKHAKKVWDSLYEAMEREDRKSEDARE